MFLSQMTSCHSCDARTHTQWGEGVKSVLGTASECGYLRCQAPGSTDSGCFCPFLFLPSFPLSTHNSGALPVGSPSHTAVTQCCIVCNMLMLVEKASDFRQKLTKGLWCCSNNNPPLLQQILLSGIFQLSHVVAFWLIVSKLVFMKHPTLTRLFALSCVLTINLAPRAATFNGLNTSCFVTVCMLVCMWKCACVPVHICWIHMCKVICVYSI